MSIAVITLDTPFKSLLTSLQQREELPLFVKEGRGEIFEPPCLQRAARQIVLDAEHGITLSEVDLACQFLDSPA